MDSSKLDLVINIIREEMTATGGNLAGLPPDEPPVDKKKKKKNAQLTANVKNAEAKKSLKKKN